MFRNKLFFSPNDGGGENTEDLDEAASEETIEDDGSTVEDDKASKRAAYDARRGKKDKYSELEQKYGNIEEKLNKFETFLEQMSEENSQAKKAGRPKGDEAKTAEMLDSVKTFMSDLSDKLTQRIDTLESTNKAEREKINRRDLLKTAGADNEFLRLVDDGIINPDPFMDDFDKLDKFIGRFSGSGTKPANGSATRTVKSVAHKDTADDGTTAVHNDKKSTNGVSDVIDTALDGIDKLFKDDRAITDHDKLTSMFELAEKVDSAKG